MYHFLPYLLGLIVIDPTNVPDNLECATPTGWRECEATTTTSNPPTASSSTSTSSSSSSSVVVPVPTTSTTLIVGGNTYYISPTGSDSASGTTMGTAWKTFGKVFNANPVLKPGDSLVLLDGTYTRTTTGLPVVNCGSNAVDGTQAKPIKIRAANERRAWLKSDGLANAFEMNNCDWYQVVGLYGSSANNQAGTLSKSYVFKFDNSDNNVYFRLLGYHNNMWFNSHVFGNENSQNTLFEECEAYCFHRHGIMNWKTRNAVLRRNYMNSIVPNCSTSDGQFSEIDNRADGDEAMSYYGGSDGLVENNISEHSNGFHVSAIENPLDPSGNGGRRNRFYGNISIDDPGTSMHHASRETGGIKRTVIGTQIKNMLIWQYGGNGIYGRTFADTLIENVTLIKGTSNNGIASDGGGALYPCGGEANCNMTIRNSVIWDTADAGVILQVGAGSLVEYTNSVSNSPNWWTSEAPGDDSGKIRRSISLVPNYGPCYLKPAPNMKGIGKNGADLGATIWFRYQDGEITNVPLWGPAFPCGAVVQGVNDGPKRCSNVHERLHVTECQ